MASTALSAGYLGTRMTLAIAPALKPAVAAPRQVTCMAKKKGIRCIITLECTEARALGETPSRYVTQKVQIILLTVFCGAYLPFTVHCVWSQQLHVPRCSLLRFATSKYSNHRNSFYQRYHPLFYPFFPLFHSIGGLSIYCGWLQNRKNTSARLELKKYNKNLRRMTLHREIK